VKLVINVEIWNIVAHIAFKFYPDASGTFSTASTSAVRWACEHDARGAVISPAHGYSESVSRDGYHRSVS